MHDDARVANLLGAAGLGVAAVVQEWTAEVAAVSASGAAALVVLDTADGLSATELGRRIGITQSAAARMVDSLAADGLVTREPGQGREVTVRLTDEGHGTARLMLDQRQTELQRVLDGLDDGERATLSGLLEKVLRRLYDHAENADRLCRLCDRGACTNGGAVCPVGKAERDDQG